MCPTPELKRLELAADAPAVVLRSVRPLDVVDAVSVPRDLRSANDESPDDAPAASVANTHPAPSSSGQLLPGQGLTDLGAVPQWTSYSLHLAAGRHRSRVLAALLVALAERVRTRVSAARVRWHQTQRAKSLQATLARLDHRTLRDLGLHRSEIGGVRRAPVEVWQDGPNVYDRAFDAHSFVPR